LGSDHSYRKDKILLARGLVRQAQAGKEELELLQRNDKKLREKYN